ncbi:MAG: HupE/UreJ family protein [Chitinophagaceae bacterium]|nr:HupE/UreJ family protein [Chitinophagaceae bacterium]
MNDFWLYFQLGWQHIADLKGIDHILFVSALCLRYQVADWRRLLILVTAFTVGHSITLALSVLDMVSFSIRWIEFLIPVTICITAFSNGMIKSYHSAQKFPPIYFLALFFGLIHGLGFSNYLKSLLGKEEAIVPRLLAFNIGLEFGQLLIVAGVLLIGLIFVTLLQINRKTFLLFVSGGIFALAFQMVIERFHFL